MKRPSIYNKPEHEFNQDGISVRHIFQRIRRLTVYLHRIWAILCFAPAFALTTLALAESAVPQSAGIIPAPARCEWGGGRFVLAAKTQISFERDVAAQTAETLRAGLKERAGLVLPLGVLSKKTDTAGAIVLGLVTNATGDVGQAEGYSLVVAPAGVVIRAPSQAGLFYGVQSLLQMVSAQTDGPRQSVTLPAVNINDAPRFAWRGVMLDESRHFFGKQTVEQLLDSMAYLKLNRFHWHLTDEPGWRIQIKKYPNLTKVGGRGNWSDPNAPAAFYTQADIREIVEYARQRHIEIIPEIDMPGHATAATRAYPEISGGGTNQWKGFTFNPAKEETYVFLENVLKEVSVLFPGKYIHLGGDEVHYGNQSWSTDPAIVKFTRDHGLTNALQLEQYFIRRMAGAVNGLGKTTVGWDEVTATGVNPSKTIAMWWHHEKPEILTQALEQDYPVVLCPRLPCYFDFVQDGAHKSGRRWQGKFVPLADVYAFPDSAIGGLIPAGKETNVLGIEACLWTEQIQNRKRLNFMTYPRLAALAEAAWTPASVKNEARFLERLHGFFRELDRRHIPYFDYFHPARTPEPPGPVKKMGGTASG